MPARHFSSVLLPDPLRPTMPKNSPSPISTETSLTASSTSNVVERNGCSIRSLSVEYRWCGSLNDLDRCSIRTAGGLPAPGTSGTVGFRAVTDTGTSRR